MPPPSFVNECAYKSLVRKHAHILKVATKKRREKVTMKINCKKKKVRAMRYESKSCFLSMDFSASTLCVHVEHHILVF